jgi:hypothetical protein
MRADISTCVLMPFALAVGLIRSGRGGARIVTHDRPPRPVSLHACRPAQV